MLLSIVLALPVAAMAIPSTAPTVVLDTAAVTGVDSGTVTKYLGIPFASAPRFRLPVPIPFYNGRVDATKYGPSCPQQLTTSSSLSRRSFEESGVAPQLITRDDNAESEDCLSINIIKPKTTRAFDNLPVVVWIYGGGFETGTSIGYDDLSTRIVTRSIETKTPVVHVAMNYRVSALGFLASKEVKKEKLGNFGLYDQRAALRWVQRYIRAFGGDPSKVTIWGQSAGAISVSLQMLAFGGKTEGLFRAGFMQSGAPVPVGDITNGQKYYDALVADTGCASSKQTLDCLRAVPYNTLVAAINKSPDFFSYTSLAAAWTPRVDGIFIQDLPYKLISAGKVANIPIVSGNVDDEGTVFSVAQSNISTEADFRDYIKNVWITDATDAELEPFWTNYPSTPSEGSPYDTGDANLPYPQYKRIASFQGDLVFQAPKRFFLQNLAGKQNVWSYLSKHWKTYSAYGSFHSSDIQLGLMDDYVIRFTNTLNPNLANSSAWPQYNATTPKLLTFADGVEPFISDDTYRAEPIKYINNLATSHPI